MKWVLAVWCLCVWSCGARLPPVPGQGGPAWVELASPHFKMWTDGSPDHGRELLQQMEHFRSIIYGVAFPDLPPGGVTFVVAFGDRREAQVFTAYRKTAFMSDSVRSPIDQPTIVLSPDLDASTVGEEVAYAVAHYAMRHTPWWLTTGFGMYFKTIELDESGGTSIVGTPEHHVRRQLEHTRVLSIERLFACTQRACSGDSFNYASSWAAFAFLQNKYPTQLVTLEHELVTKAPRDAWTATFPTVSFDQLDTQLRDWLGVGGLAVAKFKIELQLWPIQQHALGDADVHAVRALLYFDAHREEANGEVVAALALDPNNVLARTVDSDMQKQLPSLDIAKAVVAAHPDQWLAWGLLYAVTKQSPEGAAAYAKMCELVLQNPELLPYERCKSAPQPAPAP